MTKYEILLLLDPELDEARQGEIVGRVHELVDKGGGSWDLHDAWGRRRLAYEIDHKAEGAYHLLHFTSEAATLDEISRVLRIDDGVMRHMATRRIEGSPARPVAQSAPARQDAATEHAATEHSGTEHARTEHAAAAAPVAEPVETEQPEVESPEPTASEVEVEEEG